MDDWLIGVFQEEVLAQCRFAALASQDLDAALNGSDMSRIWMALQQILVSAANVSKLLWGSKDAYEADRAPLRASLEVEDDSPIRSKRLRNGFEHFDEQIDEWYRKDPQHIYLGRNVGPVESIQVDGTRERERFGHFDPVSGEVTFWDRSANLKAILGEVDRIMNVAKRRLGHD